MLPRRGRLRARGQTSRALAPVTTRAVATRAALHTVAAHILGRRRFAVSGRFGLRASPGGIATPAFGDGARDGPRYRGPRWYARSVRSPRPSWPSTGRRSESARPLRRRGHGRALHAGADTPPRSAPSTPPLDLDPRTVAGIADWFTLAWRVLDDVLGSLTRRRRGRHDPTVARALRCRHDSDGDCGGAGEPGLLTR